MTKLHWRQTGKNMWVRDLQLPLEVENRLQGEVIEDMMSSKRYKEMINREVDFIDDCWSPPVNLDDFLPRKSLQTEEVYLYKIASKFVCGEKQAASLTKSSVSHVLPNTHETLIQSMELPENAYQILQRCIMRSHVWANDSDKLPQRFFPNLPIWKPKPEFGIMPRNQARYLLTDLFRFAFLIAQPMTDPFIARIAVRDMAVSTHFTWHDDEVYFKSNHDISVCGHDALPILESRISSEDYFLPDDISPLSPLIDMERSRDYDSSHRVGVPGTYQHPHLVSVNIADLPLKWNSFAPPEASYTTQDQKNAIGIMCAFSVALASAQIRFGNKIVDGILPEPVVSQVVCCDGVHLDFACFQLNTVNFSCNDRLRNLAWVDGGNALFEKRLRNRALLREATFHDLNLETFKKFMSMFRCGLTASTV